MSKRQKALEGGQDTEIILLCAKYVACWHEQRVIAIADEWAPDEGPLHPRHEELGAKERDVARRLYKLGGRRARRAALPRWLRSRSRAGRELKSDWRALT